MTIKSKDMTDLNEVIREINDFLRTPSEDGLIIFLPVRYIVKNVKQVIKDEFKHSNFLGVDEVKELSKSIPVLMKNFDSHGTFKNYTSQDIGAMKQVPKQIALLNRIDCDSTITLGYSLEKDSLIIRVSFI